MYYSTFFIIFLSLREFYFITYSRHHWLHLLHSNIITFPITHHVRVPSLELYVHRITFSVSGHCFVPHNELLLCSFNIGTATHLHFTKPPISDFQEYLGKLIFPLEFIQFHLILYLSGINGLDGFTLSGFGTVRPHCFRFATLCSLIPIQ